MTEISPLAHDQAIFLLLTRSYAKLLGTPLVPQGADAAWLYCEAPFAVLAHNTEPDPKFIYANRAAQTCFGYGWKEFVGMPSRLSAEAPDRAERQRLLDSVAAKGFITGYSGLRIAKGGRRFSIRDGIVWELHDEVGMRQGQAATFSSWQDE